MKAIDQSVFEEEIDHLIVSLGPNEVSDSRRNEIFKFIESIITPSISGSCLLGSGSFTLKTFLAESDIDLVVLTESIDDRNILKIFNSLCEEIVLKEDGQSTFNLMQIRNVEFINARTKVAHCLVNNVGVDITVNQIGALASVTFLEEADRLIGYDHLFKRSVLLIKAWCLNESCRYNPSIVSIIGSKQGMLSSYSLSILILYLFNKFTTNLNHPFSVLRSFLFTYSGFQWDKYVLTLDGPIPIQNGTMAPPNTNTIRHNRFQALLLQFRDILHPIALNNSIRFPLRACCIQDPIDLSNNLGMSVSKINLGILDRTLKNGHQHFESLLQWHPRMTGEFVNMVKSNIPNYQQFVHQQNINQQQQNINVNNRGVLRSGSFSQVVKQTEKSLSVARRYSNGAIIIENEQNNTRTLSPPPGILSQSVLKIEVNPSTPSLILSESGQRISSPNKDEELWFLQIFFPSSFCTYISEGQIRADLLDHPMQKQPNSSINSGSNRFNLTETQKKIVSHNCWMDGDIDSMWLSLAKACEMTGLLKISTEETNSNLIPIKHKAQKESNTLTKQKIDYNNLNDKTLSNKTRDSPPSIATFQSSTSSNFSPGSSVDSETSSIDDELYINENTNLDGNSTQLNTPVKNVKLIIDNLKVNTNITIDNADIMTSSMGASYPVSPHSISSKTHTPSSNNDSSHRKEIIKNLTMQVAAAISPTKSSTKVSLAPSLVSSPVIIPSIPNPISILKTKENPIVVLEPKIKPIEIKCNTIACQTDPIKEEKLLLEKEINSQIQIKKIPKESSLEKNQIINNVNIQQPTQQPQTKSKNKKNKSNNSANNNTSSNNSRNNVINNNNSVQKVTEKVNNDSYTKIKNNLIKLCSKRNIHVSLILSIFVIIISVLYKNKGNISILFMNTKAKNKDQIKIPGVIINESIKHHSNKKDIVIKPMLPPKQLVQPDLELKNKQRLIKLIDTSFKLRANAVSHWLKIGDSISFGESSFSDLLSDILINADYSIEDSNLIVSNTLYQWQKDGVNITNPSSNNLYIFIKNSTLNDSGSYRCIASTGKVKGIVLAETILKVSSK
jgi:hypothetical protein